MSIYWQPESEDVAGALARLGDMASTQDHSLISHSDAVCQFSILVTSIPQTSFLLFQKVMTAADRVSIVNLNELMLYGVHAPPSIISVVTRSSLNPASASLPRRLVPWRTASDWNHGWRKLLLLARWYPSVQEEFQLIYETPTFKPLDADLIWKCMVPGTTAQTGFTAG
ncbi:hypothetical protein B0H19DRAFT_1079293 [Mycena capillaripes]|nr:hypothetical protein B0H19DRAFT_1079293 [Mycena capillaripes]